MNDVNIKIIVCCHKLEDYKNDDIHIPIHCGKAIGMQDLGIQGDDTGENISKKNQVYCELSGLYWAWKNMKNIDYVGLCHYRRYFAFGKRRRMAPRYYYRKYDDIDISNVRKYIISLLKESDFVVVKKRYRVGSNKDSYNPYVPNLTFDVLVNVVEDLYPEYKITLISFLNSNKFYPCNMFITNWSMFDNYSTWLFKILFELEVRLINMNIESDRVYALIGELLLSVYLLKNNFKVTEISSYHLSDNPLFSNYIKESLIDVKINMIYKFFYFKL